MKLIDAPVLYSFIIPLLLVSFFWLSESESDSEIATPDSVTYPVAGGDQGSPLEDFVPYTEEFSDEASGIDLIPVEGGGFVMGRNPGSDDYIDEEGPATEVEVSSFWMGTYEITWEQYEQFMYSEGLEALHERFTMVNADAVTRPSRTYIDPSMGMGRGQNPAVSMTQHAALAFTRWLSLRTGTFYRLPTEAEWEYACRAGTETEYHFGDDPGDLDRYGWYFGNTDQQYEEVGQKEPNPWGLYDMHGNVAEWTLDQFIPDYHEQLVGNPAQDPWVEPTDLEPNTVRGGSWYHDPEDLRCTARIGSNPERWKRGDPQFPKSLWWNTNAPFVGFRIVRPLEQPSEKEMEKFWEATLDEFHYD